MSTVTTAYGEVSLDTLIHNYEVYRSLDKRRQEKRREFLQTEEGKKYNRERAKAYYERNKEKVREKNRNRYTAKHHGEQPTAAPENPESV